ncbi:hypothetical protein PUN28_020180 [Cardiocondyla obscurior]|uniref:Ribosomal protein L20 n=1 Tax=Cardiocondyla obscurior TaxID=286306 RepID=A0AAW2ECE2_9HYME
MFGHKFTARSLRNIRVKNILRISQNNISSQNKLNKYIAQVRIFFCGFTNSIEFLFPFLIKKNFYI